MTNPYRFPSLVWGGVAGVVKPKEDTMQIGKTYRIHDGAGCTAFRCDGVDENGYFGLVALEADGDEVTDCGKLFHMDDSDVIEEMNGVVWPKTEDKE